MKNAKLSIKRCWRPQLKPDPPDSVLNPRQLQWFQSIPFHSDYTTLTHVHRVGIEVRGPPTLSKKRNRYILVTVDHPTKLPEAEPMGTQDTIMVTTFLWLLDFSTCSPRDSVWRSRLILSYQKNPPDLKDIHKAIKRCKGWITLWLATEGIRKRCTTE